MTVILATGDLVLEAGDAAAILTPATATLGTADVVLGHLEIPHVTTGTVLTTDVPALPGPPSALGAVAAAGIGVLSLAGNHVWDFGADGIEETRRHCEARGIRTVGTGRNLDEAFTPVRLGDAPSIAVFSINCVGPRESWATTLKPGAAYIEVITHYADRGANPGGPPRISTFAERTSLERAQQAVARAAAAGDVVVVALHKGLVHVPVQVADYEREISYALIDAGAGAVIGHHAHIMRGVEVYRGRPIFHGLGNFATVTRALSAAPGDAAERADWARERVQLFGFAPDPQMPTYPFHPESRSTALARIEVGDDGGLSAGIIPFWIDDDARPVPAADIGRRDAVQDYIRRITAAAGFATAFDESGYGLSIRLEGAAQ